MGICCCSKYALLGTCKSFNTSPCRIRRQSARRFTLILPLQTIQIHLIRILNQCLTKDLFHLTQVCIRRNYCRSTLKNCSRCLCRRAYCLLLLHCIRITFREHHLCTYRLRQHCCCQRYCQQLCTFLSFHTFPFLYSLTSLHLYSAYNIYILSYTYLLRHQHFLSFFNDSIFLHKFNSLISNLHGICRSVIPSCHCLFTVF